MAIDLLVADRYAWQSALTSGDRFHPHRGRQTQNPTNPPGKGSGGTPIAFSAATRSGSGRRKLVSLLSPAIGSYRHRNCYIDRFRFSMLKAFREYPQCQRLGFGGSLLACGAVRQHSWQLRNFSNPTPIFLDFAFNDQIHDHTSLHFWMPANNSGAGMYSPLHNQVYQHESTPPRKTSRIGRLF